MGSDFVKGMRVSLCNVRAGLLEKLATQVPGHRCCIACGCVRACVCVWQSAMQMYVQCMDTLWDLLGFLDPQLPDSTGILGIHEH